MQTLIRSHILIWTLGAQWLSGRVLNWDRGACGSSLTGVTCVVSLSKAHYPCLALVQTRNTSPNITEKLLKNHLGLHSLLMPYSWNKRYNMFSFECTLQMFFISVFWTLWIYSKTSLMQPLKKKTKIVFTTDFRLMQVKSIAKCSRGSILQYFWPSLSYSLSLRSLFCLFLSYRLRQVLLYNYIIFKISFFSVLSRLDFCTVCYVNCHL